MEPVEAFVVLYTLLISFLSFRAGLILISGACLLPTVGHKVTGWFSQTWHCIFDFSEDATLDDIHFYLFTPIRNEFVGLDPAMSIIKSEHFNILLPTKMVIHGYSQNCQDSHMRMIREAYLSKGTYNVIMVDWCNLASAPCYVRATWKSRGTGQLVALLIDQFALSNVNIQTFHLIGFSLGAQVAGFAGMYISHGDVGRITGLDPAMPLFTANKPEAGLDAGDAFFVDIIHTAGNVLGVHEALGHADFYPNGGSLQPGCDWASDPTGLEVICSHDRAVAFFAESITSEVGFKAVLCKSWEDFKAGKCNTTTSNNTAYMGEPCTKKAHGSYYLTTSCHKPFAVPVTPTENGRLLVSSMNNTDATKEEIKNDNDLQ